MSQPEHEPTSDEQAFLRAIRAAPEDSAPRLVYADWLEERRDPRAEYLRLLCMATGPRDEAVLACLRELRSGLDRTWVALVQPPGLDDFHWYRIVRPVSRGGRTTVCEAIHKHPNFGGRRVALKVLTDHRFADQFMVACQMHALLEHPHIPRLHEVAYEDLTGRLFSVRAFVDGNDLQQNIGRAAYDTVEVARIVSAIAAALGHAHRLGIVHGCVHPRHLLLGRDGSVWLIGFGEYPLPPSAEFGNPLHLAPEQFDNGPATPQTDVYLVAESAAWLLLGQHPFGWVWGPGPLLAAKRAGQLWDAGPGNRTRLPGRTEPVLRRAMSPDPADRYQTPVEFAEAFAAAVRPDSGRPWWRIW